MEPIFVQIYNIEPLLAGAIKTTKVDLVEGWFLMALKSIRDIVHVSRYKINGIIKVVFVRITSFL